VDSNSGFWDLALEKEDLDMELDLPLSDLTTCLIIGDYANTESSCSLLTVFPTNTSYYACYMLSCTVMMMLL